MGLFTNRGRGIAPDAGESDGEAMSRLHGFLREKLNDDDLATCERMLEDCGIRGAVSRDEGEVDRAFQASPEFRQARDAWRASRRANDMALDGLRSRLVEDAAQTMARASSALSRSHRQGQSSAGFFRRFPQAKRLAR
jgi:hypothetical protein